MTKTLTSKALLVATGLCALLATTANAADFVFTAPPRDAGGDESELYKPIADYLSAVTGKRIVYQHSDNWLTYQDKMRKGEYDLIFDGPHFMSWRIMKLQHEPLARLPGKLDFVVIARKDNDKVNSLKDLNGRTVCGMAPPNLATLTMYAQYENAARQPLVISTKSFKEAYEMVLAGKCMGGAMGAGFFKKLDKGETKILFHSPGMPNQVFSASARFADADKAKMAEALVAPEARTKMAKFFEVFSKEKDLVKANRAEYDGLAVLLKDVYGFDIAQVSAVDPKVGK